MPTNTWHWTIDGARAIPPHDGIAQIYNGSDDLIEVRAVRAIPLDGARITGGAGTWSWSRITATSGGAAVTPVQHDGTTSLPAEVTCVRYPTSVTTTGIVLRRQSTNPAWSATLAGGARAARRFSARGLEGASAMQLCRGSDVQAIVLAAGEGIALVGSASGQPGLAEVSIVAVNPASGATYTWRALIGTRREGVPIVALMNGAGSGIALHVRAIYVQDVGEASFPTLRLVRTRSRIEDDEWAAAGTVVAASSDSAALPGTVLFREGPFWTELWDVRSGVPIDWRETHGATMTIARQQAIGSFRARLVAHQPRAAGIGTTFPMMDSMFFQARGTNDGIWLRKGEGVALCTGRAGAIDSSALHNYDVAIELRHTPAAAGAAVFSPLHGWVVA